MKDSSKTDIPQTDKTELFNPCKPIFKPLIPLNPKDIALFLGRNKEVEDLYQMTFNTNLLLVYGPASSGKSSLVRCGLANKFAPTKWEGIIIERQEDINQALHRQLALEWNKVATTSEEVATSNPLEILHKVQDANFKPIYLIFDHLELLFTQNPNAGEQQQFFGFLQELARSEGTVKAILIMDEAQLAQLTSFETVLPNLFEHRFRLEGMSNSDIVFELGNWFGLLGEKSDLKVSNPDLVAQTVVQRLSAGKDHAEMACMQVYLHQLQQEACKSRKDGQPVIDPELIDRVPPPKELIGAYLDEQRTLLREQQQLPGKNLDTLQQQLDNLDQIQTRCQGTPPAAAAAGPPAWVSWLGWLLLLLLLLFLVFFFFFRKGENNAPTPENCAEYVAYLREFGMDGPLSVQYRELLAAGECREQLDCWETINANSCAAYIQYLQQYRSNGPCSDEFAGILLKQCVFNEGIPVQDCQLLVEVLPGTIGDEVLCLLYKNYLETYGEQDSCSLNIKAQLARLDCGGTAAPESYETLAANCAAIRSKLEQNIALNQSEKNTLEACDCQQAKEDDSCRAYETYLKQYGDQGLCSAEFREELEQCAACETVRKKNSCAAYEEYLNKYGNGGRCSAEFRTKLAELRSLGCPLPIGQICYLKACPTPVSWVEAQTGCDAGWRLVCTNQIRFLLDNYYGGDLKSTYSNWFNAGQTSLDFSDAGFWTATESTDNTAYAIETGGGLVRILGDQSKSQKRPCLCIKKGEDYEKSGLNKLECLSKSLNN